VTPFVAAGLIWWRRRSLFRHYALATATTFAIGLVGFILVPTAPPWLSDPDDVTRITHEVLRDTAGDGGMVARDGFWVEPNHLAALPSVHVAAAVLVFLALRSFGRVALAVGAVYAVAMSYSVVYLGEHFVIDVVLGWVVALVGWRLARRR
jgi:membrane-associated phospholipid phosphatase